MSQKRAIPGSVVLRLWLERTAPVAVVCVLMLCGGLLLTQQSSFEQHQCEGLYARARTAADTGTVDVRWANAKQRISCGRLRREGVLDAAGRRDR